jgi:hypothetical protein
VVKFTSRILEGLTAWRGLVEPREGIGCWVSGYWPLSTLQNKGGPFLSKSIRHKSFGTVMGCMERQPQAFTPPRACPICSVAMQAAETKERVVHRCENCGMIITIVLPVKKEGTGRF